MATIKQAEAIETVAVMLEEAVYLCRYLYYPGGSPDLASLHTQAAHAAKTARALAQAAWADGARAALVARQEAHIEAVLDLIVAD